MVAALTGNRAEGEADLVLLSAKDGSVIENLTKGFTGEFENITAERRLRGRPLHRLRSPAATPSPSSRARASGAACTWSPCSRARSCSRVPVELDQAQAPCLLPDGRHALFAALKEGVSDIYLRRPRDGRDRRTSPQDAFARRRPPGLARRQAGRLHAAHQRPRQDLRLPARRPARRRPSSPSAPTTTTRPSSPPTATRIYYSSTEDDDIYNLRSLDLQTGVDPPVHGRPGRQHGARAAPRQGRATRVGFISYFKGEYRLQSIEIAEPMKEVEQEVQVAAEELVDFQPDVMHQVVPENKRRKRMFEKLFLEGRPPLNVGVTSSGDFFGGSQVALSDVLGDQNFVVHRALRCASSAATTGTYINLGAAASTGASAASTTRSFFYASPYALQPSFFREGRLRHPALHRRPRSSRSTRSTSSAASSCQRRRHPGAASGSRTPLAEQLAREQAAQRRARRSSSTTARMAPVSRGPGRRDHALPRVRAPVRAAPTRSALQLAPGVGGAARRGTRSRSTRASTSASAAAAVLAAPRPRLLLRRATNPDIFYFGGNMELRGLSRTCPSSGNQGFFANLELRFPIIDLMKTPHRHPGPGARDALRRDRRRPAPRAQPYEFGTRDAGRLLRRTTRSSASRSPASTWWTGAPPTASGSSSSSWATRCTSTGRSSPTSRSARQGTRFDFWIGFDF